MRDMTTADRVRVTRDEETTTELHQVYRDAIAAGCTAEQAMASLRFHVATLAGSLDEASLVWTSDPEEPTPTALRAGTLRSSGDGAAAHQTATANSSADVFEALHVLAFGMLPYECPRVDTEHTEAHLTPYRAQCAQWVSGA